MYDREYNTMYARLWRHAARRCLIEALGAACVACGYDACAAAMDFHHVYREDKDGEIGQLLAQRAWPKVVKEARKCVLLCCRCHREVHSGYRSVSIDKSITYDIPTVIKIDLPTRPLKKGSLKECPVSTETLRLLRDENSFDRLAIILGSNKRTVMRWCSAL